MRAEIYTIMEFRLTYSAMNKSYFKHRYASKYNFENIYWGLSIGIL